MGWRRRCHSRINFHGAVGGIFDAADRTRDTAAFLEPVVHSDVRPQIPFPLLLKNVFRQAMLSKTTDWDYQREWRLIAQTEHVEFLQPGEFTEVIVGNKVSEEIQNLAKKLKTH